MASPAVIDTQSDALGGLDGFDAALSTLIDSPLAGLSSATLLETARRFETARRVMSAFDHRLIDELSVRGVAGELGCASTATLLSVTLRLSPAEAKARVAAAAELGAQRSLTGEVLPPRFPALAAAQLEGDISPAHAAVVTRAIRAIPSAVYDDVADFVERTLTEQAAHRHPDSLATVARHLLDRIDPDGVLADERDHIRRREVTLTNNRDGSANLSGRLTPQCAEKLRTVFDALAKPAPAVTTLGAARRDLRTAGQRRHDAFESALDRVLRVGSLPDSGGIPATVLITMTHEQYRQSTGLATTGHGGLLSVDAALALADEARVVTVVHEPGGRVVATRSANRVATTAQRLALVARDRGCSFPDCDVPAAWCQAHHVVEWSRGGPTTLDNLTLLCGHHHRTFEQAGWTGSMEDGLPHWRPPAHVDPIRTPVRNTAHQLAPPG